ncbi:hypothetical protein GF351_00380 [Candidatus Woesearchaeota archaeon]|nr:hypothetical protein [Candidatus Woesearchaeota archaeon]
MKTNLKKHEIVGLILVFFSWTCLGFGLYVIMWAVNRAVVFNSPDYLLKGWDFLLIPLFFGTAALLWVFGKVELQHLPAGKKR